MNQIYETDRLILKIIDKSYAQIVLDYFLRNKTFLEEWEAKGPKDFNTVHYHERRLDEDVININTGKGLRFWIFKKTEPDKTIGTISFNNIVRGAFLSCHLGYKLDEEELNKGYITEAIKKGIDIVFNEIGLHRIEANIMPKNKRSLRVVEKLGFYNEGLAYKYLRINGKWEDHIHMVLLNENV